MNDDGFELKPNDQSYVNKSIVLIDPCHPWKEGLYFIPKFIGNTYVLGDYYNVINGKHKRLYEDIVSLQTGAINRRKWKFFK